MQSATAFCEFKQRTSRLGFSVCYAMVESLRLQVVGMFPRTIGLDQKLVFLDILRSPQNFSKNLSIRIRFNLLNDKFRFYKVPQRFANASSEPLDLASPPAPQESNLYACKYLRCFPEQSVLSKNVNFCSFYGHLRIFQKNCALEYVSTFRLENLDFTMCHSVLQIQAVNLSTWLLRKFRSKFKCHI